MFDFRIIDTLDGNQIIDRTLKTPEYSLTPSEMIDYIEMDKQMFIMDSIRKKKQKEEEQLQKKAKNPLRRIACFCGLM